MDVKPLPPLCPDPLLVSFEYLSRGDLKVHIFVRWMALGLLFPPLAIHLVKKSSNYAAILGLRIGSYK